MTNGTEQTYKAKETSNDIANINLKDLLNRFIKYLPVLIVCFVMAIFLMWLYLRYTTPIYSSTGKLYIKKDEQSAMSGSDFFKDVPFFNGGQNIDNEIEYIKSSTITKRVVAKLGLEQSCFVKGKIKILNLYKRAPFGLLVFERKDSTKSFVVTFKVLDDNTFTIEGSKEVYTFGQKLTNLNGTFAVFKKPSNIHLDLPAEIILTAEKFEDKVDIIKAGLKVRQVNKQAEVMELVYESDNAELAADLVNEYMRQYNEAILEDKGKAAAQTLAFIEDRLQRIYGELQEVEKGLKDFQQANQIVDITEQSRMVLSAYKDYDQTLSKQSVQYNNIDYLYEYVTDGRNKNSMAPYTEGLQDPTLVNLIVNYNKLVLERNQQVNATTPDHPLSIELTKSVETQRKALTEQIKNIRSAYSLSKNNTNNKLNEILSQISSIPNKEKELLVIKRQQEIKSGLYTFLLKKREETAITKAATTNNAQPIDVARPGRVPVKPIKLIFYALAGILGLILPVIFLYLKEILNDKIYSKADIEKITQAPIIGSVIHSEEKNVVLVVNKNRKVIAEQFRIIRTNLFYFLTKNEKPTIMVTSSFSGEGKSFFSTNLGAVFAVSGKRTVVLEFDLRKPKIASYLNIDKKTTTGITQYLVGKASVESLSIQSNEIENLYIIPCGDVPPNPAELILNPRMKDLFAYLKSNFDVVIIDTAPVGLVSDANLLSEYADATIFVVRHGYTHKPQLELVDDLYKSKKLPALSIVINDIRAASMPYYGNHNYGYGHGYYGDEDITPWYKKVFRVFSRN